MRLEEPEVLEHRMVGEADLANNAHRLRLGFDTGELDAVVGGVTLDAVEMLEKVEVPPRAAVFAVGRELQPQPFLLGNDLHDLAVLDLAELRGGDLTLLPLGSRILERRRAQDAADMVGTERWSGHGTPPW